MITCSTCMSHAQKSPLNLKLICAINLLKLAPVFCFHEGILFILADLKIYRQKNLQFVILCTPPEISI